MKIINDLQDVTIDHNYNLHYTLTFVYEGAHEEASAGIK